MSEYRDASGRFDIDKANADYEKLLTKVPEEYKMSIETAYKTTDLKRTRKSAPLSGMIPSATG